MVPEGVDAIRIARGKLVVIRIWMYVTGLVPSVKINQLIHRDINSVINGPLPVQHILTLVSQAPQPATWPRRTQH